jgi:TolA-binding protein
VSRRGWTSLALGVVLAACAPTLPDAYTRARAAAERAYAAGRYEEAARSWQAAAATADRPHHRNEARYRAAVSLRRAGRWADAMRAYQQLAESAPRSSRAARAAYDRAELELRHGDAKRGRSLLERVVSDYPDSAAAQSAVRRIVVQLEATEGPAGVRSWLAGLIPAHQAHRVGESLHYFTARALQQQGRAAAARDRYLWTAARYPYPRGALWDDSLFHAAELEERLGDPRAAIRHLERMLAEREASHLQGSYERPRFAQARYRIAEIHRDRLGDDAAARREFARVWHEHPTSLLRDDARWNEALLAARQGDAAGACRALSSLIADAPDSRFAPCAPRVCPGIRGAPTRSCRAYVARNAQAGR